MELKEQIEGCINNDNKSQEFLFKNYSRKLMAVCIRYFDKIEDAEDVLSETFIKIFNSVKQFRGLDEKSFYCWIKRITINECLGKIKKDKSKSTQNSLENYEYRLADENVYNQIGEKELLKMIQELPKGFRAVFNLHAIEGYGHDEIGEMLGISQGTSKSQYSRAKSQLREKLELEGVTCSSVN